MPRQAGDLALWVKFEQREVLNEAKSYGYKVVDNDGKILAEVKGEGRPIFDNVDYVQIVIPGDKTSQVDRPVTFCGKIDENRQVVDAGGVCRFNERPSDCDVHRFYDEWKLYKDGQTEQTSGTPLKAWPGIQNRGLIEELAYLKVYTVEQLAQLSDSNANRFFAHRQRARDYLKAAEKMAGVADLRAELDAKNAQMSAMQEQINQLIAVHGKSKSEPKAEPRAEPTKEVRR